MNIDVDFDIETNNETKFLELTDTAIIKSILNELIEKIETDSNNKIISVFDSPKNLKDSDSSIFSFINTCDSCGIQDSLFWRRVARTKIVCNKCFFSQTYLLLFRESKEKKKHSTELNQDENNEPIRYTKKTRASLKNINKPELLSLSNSNIECLNENSSTSSCSVKTNEKSEPIEGTVHEKIEPIDEDLGFIITRKSARFIVNSNKSKKNEKNNSGNNNNKKARLSPKSEDTQSDKASPLNSPNSLGFRPDSKIVSPNLKSRRSKVFKSEKFIPVKSQVLTSSIITGEFVFHRGFYMQVGDIVALFDLEDKNKNIPYFAQIRAFLTDQYGEKSAVLTWLIPIDSNYAKLIRTAKDFNPDMFVLGPAEEYPRPLKCIEFVCRLVDIESKNNYYFNNSYQFKNDLQRHKYLLNDLAESNLRLISKKSSPSFLNDTAQIEYEIKFK